MENSGYESPLIMAGTVLLVILSCAIHLIRNGKELKSKREFELIMSKPMTLPYIQKISDTPKPTPISGSQHATSDETMQEVIAALIKIGHTKTEAKKIVSELCANSTFDSSEELLQAAFSK